jgi:hypothetical protein
MDGGTTSSPNYLMCLFEELNEENQDNVHFSLVVPTHAICRVRCR